MADSIGIRWAGTDAERCVAEYIRSRFDEDGLVGYATEEFDLNTWESSSSSISIVGEEDRGIDARPSLFYPAVLFGHSSSDMIDKVRVRELMEYV